MCKLPVTVVIPVLNAEASLAKAIASVAPKVAAVVVVDGGSTDATRAVATASGAVCRSASRGRGTQLAAGAEAVAGSDWLLFLHADTRLADGWAAEVAAFLAAPGAETRAAAFAFRLDDDSRQARRLERMVAWRCRRFGLPYGDQGLLIHRQLYEEIGGFRPIPLMEDVDIVRRIGRSRLRILATPAVTSAERFRRDGYWRRSAKNLGLLCLYVLGVSPERLARLYG